MNSSVRYIHPSHALLSQALPRWALLLRALVLWLAWLAGPAAVEAQMPAPPDVEPELRDRLVAADHTVLDGRFQDALDELREVAREHPVEAEVLWRLSRVKVDVGIDVDDDPVERERLFLTALELAYQAESLDPGLPETHLAIAMAAAQAGLDSSTRELVEYSREVLRHTDHVLELNGAHDVAYHVRGRWNHEVASLGFMARTTLRLVYGGLPDASLERAEEDFRRAIEIEDRIVHRLELARTLIEKGRKAEAPAHLERALRMPHYAPRDPLYQQQARELLEELRANGGYER